MEPVKAIGQARDPLATAVLLLLGLPWLIYLNANCYVTASVRLPIPAFLVGLLLIVLGALGRLRRPELSMFPPWLLAVLAVMALSAVRRPLENAVYVAVLYSTFLLFRLFVGADPRRFALVCRIFVAALILSGGFLFLSHADPLLGLMIRGRLFGPQVLTSPNPTGLAVLIHLFGYQAAALGGVCVAMAYQSGRRGWLGVWRQLLWLALCAAVVMLGWQRSALLGSALALATIVARRGARPVLAALALSLLLAGILAMTGGGSAWGERTLIAKEQADVHETYRFELQAETLKIVARNPWGLDLIGQQWGPEIYEWGGALSQGNVSGHNAYLMKVAYLGLPVLLLIGYTLWKTGRAIWRNGLAPGSSETLSWPNVLSLALIATLANALLHNASLYTAEGATGFCFVAFWHWMDVRGTWEIGRSLGREAVPA